jgi:MFS family permease
MAVVGVASYAVYLAIILTKAAGHSLVETDYVATLLWTVGAAIVASIVLRIIGSIFSRDNKDRKDARDRQIYQFGQSVGIGFIIAGAVGAMVLAFVVAPHFWIANVIYLGFVLASVAGSIARVAAYRGEFRGW